MRKIAVFLLLFCSLPALAELQIEVTKGLKNATPIAVVPFAGSALSGANKLSSIISADLHRSGMFAPLAANDMLSRPTSKDDIIYRDFRVLGIPYLVIGQIKQAGAGSFRVHYALYDVNRQKLMLGQTFKASGTQMRDVAHAISDKLFEKLTGIPGVFSTKILYVTFNRHSDYPYQLQYADADGHRAKTVLRSKQPIMSPAWSPDHKSIAYVSFENNGWPAIYIHELATGKRRIVSRASGINGAPAFSPDGSKLAMTLSKDGNAEIYVLDIASGDLTRLTHNYSIDTGPSWMPDGEGILFTSGRGGGPQIYKMRLDDKSVSRVTFHGSYNARADITPDGRFLVYVHRQAGKFHIAVQDLIAGTFRTVTETRFDESPSIAPNGSMVVYGTLYQGKGVLEAVSIDGKVKIRLPSKRGQVRDPAWSPYM